MADIYFKTRGKIWPLLGSALIVYSTFGVHTNKLKINALNNKIAVSQVSAEQKKTDSPKNIKRKEQLRYRTQRHQKKKLNTWKPHKLLG